MGPIPRNIVANIAGQGWAAAMSLLLVPVYLHLLGVEAFGLIGFFATLQASLQVLDLGLSQTMSRQLARYATLPARSGEARDFVRTVEVGYWMIGLAIGAVVSLSAPLVATRWLNVSGIPLPVVERAIRVMGIVAALQWPLSLYDGGLTGLQRQVLLNALKIAVSTVGAIGTALVLWLWSPTVTAYFGWQVVVSGLGVVALAASLWRALPRAPGRAHVVPGLVRVHGRLAAGMGGIAVTGILLSQLDKVLLSRFLPLESFGYYALAGVVASAVPLLLAGPVFNGIFPQLTALVAAGAEREVAELYHRGTQLMAVLVSAVAGVIACFSQEILLVWTRNALTAARAAPIVSVLVVGMAVNALMALPYALQLAYGWTSLGVRLNAALLVLLVPAIAIIATSYGPVGAAAVWVGLNALYMLVGVPLTHRRLLKGQMGSWFVADVLPPAGAALLALAAGRLLVRADARPLVTVLAIAAVFLVALVAAVAAAPLVRRSLLQLLARDRVREER